MEIPMLTREYIMNLEAGREMDEHIIRMMGYNIVEAGTVFWNKKDAPFPFVMHDQVWGMCLYEDEGEEDSWSYRKFNPSEDISSAFEVVDELNGGLYAFELGRAGDYFEPDRKWQARFGMTGWVEADTAPLAICRAALLTTIQGEG